MMEKIKRQLVFLFSGGLLIFANLALAQGCPLTTTVSGTNVTFVGELADTGGDTINYVWFEYGESTNYGQKTSEQALTKATRYCINVSGLSPCTTYHYRAGARNSAGTSYGEDKTFTTSCGPSVDIKANGSNGPVTIAYGSAVTLSWNSTNTNYCTASGDWSGSKPISGSESTGNLTSSKIYQITCTGNNGSVSDSVVINVGSSPNLIVKKFVRNLSDGTIWSNSTLADPGEIISFWIEVTGQNAHLDNVTIKETLADGLIYRQNTLKIDEVLSNGDIFSGLNLGSLKANQKKIITFEAAVAGADKFSFGETQLINSVTVSAANTSLSDTAKVFVQKKAVAGAATTMPTGLTNNLILDSFLIPLTIALFLIWLLKRKIIKFEEWLDKRKSQYQEYKSKKLLQSKIRKIRLQEFLKRP